MDQVSPNLLYDPTSVTSCCELMILDSEYEVRRIEVGHSHELGSMHYKNNSQYNYKNHYKQQVQQITSKVNTKPSRLSLLPTKI